MTFDTERRALDLFDRASELPEAARTQYLDEQCGEDRELRNIVERMLDEHTKERESDFFAAGIGAAIAASGFGDGDALDGSDSIGRYSIIREIGRGGMGVVYEARQSSPARRVAIKVITDKAASEELRSRFRRESEVLGTLHHPGIASVIEAGVEQSAGSELPFIVMEFVDGMPLDKHIATHTLSRNEILTLFESICAAVEHAHQHGVIHRDLKPSNVLVTSQDTGVSRSSSDSALGRVGQPKILDFGVARLIGTDDGSPTIQTHAGQLIGTLNYMSPEQVEGRPEAVDARSDIYALGVMLYQALTNSMPINLSGKPVPEAARLIREEEPVPLSTLDASLRGDLEIIVSKALEKEPERRFASAADLAEDLRRHRMNEAISARAPSTLYQARKFVARNRVLVGGVAVSFLLLVAGVTGISIGLISSLAANRELDRSS